MDKQLLRESIKRELRQRILSGDLPPGSRVPSEFELVRQLGVSRSQTRSALVGLEEEGLIVRRQGSGSYVASISPDLPESTRRYDTAKIVIPEYRSQYVRDLVEAFMAGMFAAAMKVTTFQSQQDAAAEATYLSLADRMGVAGLVIWIVHDTEPARRALNRLARHRFPLVLVDRYASDCQLDVVRSDHRAIGDALASALLDRGHRHIAVCPPLTDTASSVMDRLRGAADAFERAGCGIRVDTAPLSDEPAQHAVEVARVMARRDRPTAFLCVNDDMAAWVERELDELGWRGSGEVEIACVRDGAPEFRGLFPTIAVQQDGRGIGRACAQALAARIADPGRPPEERLIPCSPVMLLEPIGAEAEEVRAE